MKELSGLLAVTALAVASAFAEKGSLDGTGEGYETHSNLWVDTMHRPIKFKVGQTIGLRAGFEDIDDRLTPR